MAKNDKKNLAFFRGMEFEKIPYLMLPTVEPDSFSEFRTDSDITDLITDIQAQPSKFGPEKIKAAFDYAREKFKDIGRSVKLNDTLYTVDQGTHKDIFLICVTTCAYDPKIISYASIRHRGISLKQNTSLDKESLDALYQRTKDFAPSRFHKPIIVVPKDIAFSINRDVFEDYKIRLGQNYFGSGHNYYIHPGRIANDVGLLENLKKGLIGKEKVEDITNGNPNALIYLKESKVGFNYSTTCIEPSVEEKTKITIARGVDNKYIPKKDGKKIRMPGIGTISEWSDDKKEVTLYTCNIHVDGPNQPVVFVNNGPKEMPLYFVQVL